MAYLGFFFPTAFLLFMGMRIAASSRVTYTASGLHLGEECSLRSCHLSGSLAPLGTRLVVDVLGRSVCVWGGGGLQACPQQKHSSEAAAMASKGRLVSNDSQYISPNSGAAYPPGPCPLGTGCRDPGVLRVRDEAEMPAPHCEAFS